MHFPSLFRHPPPPTALVALLCISLIACKMPNDPMNTLPRNQSLPKFNPHMTTFKCEIEATKVPPIDAQAEAWFLTARALESPETIEEDRDYKRIVDLTRMASDRKHWRAMLNLASLYLEKRDPTRGVHDALKLIDEAMLLGIPAAYERMGTYFMNGTGVDGDVTRAYAFWQRAAQMGSPQAMTFLATKLNATYDSPNDGWWANIPVATRMLECAFGQGYGPAADPLSSLIAGSRPVNGRGSRTAEASARAVKVLHEGVKLGCEDCANSLRSEFNGSFNISDILTTYIDKARAQRYMVILLELGFDPTSRFPNLDQVLPLPPAPLPYWNGDRDTLLNAAKGVKPKLALPKPTAASVRTDRHSLDAAFILRHTGDKTNDDRAPREGYWQPSGHQQPERICALLAKIPPGLYRAEEPFEPIFDPTETPRRLVFGIVWERWETKWHNEHAVEPRAVSGQVRELSRDGPIKNCSAGRACPDTGVWQPWLHSQHPLRAIVNQHWRQVWLTKGQAFPNPEQDWLLDLPVQDLTWHLLDDQGVSLT